MTAKQQALSLINSLPDHCTPEDIVSALGSVQMKRTRIRAALEFEQTEIRFGNQGSRQADPATAYEQWQSMVSI